MRLVLLACVVGCRAAAPIARPTPPSPPPPEPSTNTSLPRDPQIPIPRPAPDLAATTIRRVIRQRMAPLAACYEQLSPGDRRRVVIRFTIGPTGTVLRSSASGPQGDLENCIAAAFAGTTFEPPANGGTVTVTYPLQFRPG